MATQPSLLPTWTEGPSANCVVPPSSLMASGWTAGQRPPVEYINWLQWSVGAWLQYLLQQSGNLQQTAALDPTVRLLGGGTWSWDQPSGTLSWSDTLYVSCASVADSANAIAAGSVQLGGSGGDLAYVQCNIPFAATGSISSGGVTLTLTSNQSSVSQGMAVSGPGIPSGTTVAGFDGAGNPQLSQPATADESAQVYIFASTGTPSVQVAQHAAFVPSLPTVVIARSFGQVCIVGANSGQMVLRNGEQKMLLGSGYVSTITAPAGVALTAGQAVYLSSAADNRTPGSLYPVDVGSANGALRGQFVGFVTTATAAGSNAQVCSSGLAPLFSGLTAGQVYFADPANPGGITATMPTSVGQYIVPVGFALSSSALRLNPTATQTLTAIQSGLTVVGALSVKLGKSGTAIASYDSTGNNVVASVDTSGNLTLAGMANISGAMACAGLTATGATINGGLTVNNTGGAQLSTFAGNLTVNGSQFTCTAANCSSLTTSGTIVANGNITGRATVSANVLQSAGGIKRDIFMGGYSTTSFGGGSQPLVANYSGGDKQRRTIMRYPGSLLAIGVAFDGQIGVNVVTAINIYKNGSPFFTANIGYNTSYTGGTANFSKGQYTFAQGDVLSAYINYSTTGVSISAQCDITVESDG